MEILSRPQFPLASFNCCRLCRPPFLKSSRIRRGNVWKCDIWLVVSVVSRGFLRVADLTLNSINFSNTIVTSVGELVRSRWFRVVFLCWHLLGVASSTAGSSRNCWRRSDSDIFREERPAGNIHFNSWVNSSTVPKSYDLEEPDSVTYSGELTEYSGGSVGGPQSCLSCGVLFAIKKHVGWMVAYTENWGKEYRWVCGWFGSSPSWSKWLGLNIVQNSCFFCGGKRGAPMVPGKILFEIYIYTFCKKNNTRMRSTSKKNQVSIAIIQIDFFPTSKNRNSKITWWCFPV